MYSVITVMCDVFIWLLGATLALLLYLCVIGFVIALFEIGRWLLDDSDAKKI